MNVQILLFEGFDELDALAPYEVFANAARRAHDWRVRLVTLDGAERVTGSHGVVVVPHERLAERPDLVVVPGGGWNERRGAGAWAAAEQGEVPAAIARLHGAGATIAGVCTGGMLLARSGILDGRPAVTHAAALRDLAESGARVIDARVVDDGEILSAGGVTSGLDLALHVVERELGAAAAEQVATEIEYERRGEVWRETGEPT